MEKPDLIAGGQRPRDREFEGLVSDPCPIPKWLCDPQTGEVVTYNDAFADLFSDVIADGAPLSIRDVLIDTEKNETALRRLADDGFAHNAPVLGNCGPEEGAWLKLSAIHGNYRGRPVIVCSILDVDDGSGGDQDIRKARDVLRDAIDSLSEGFALYDDDSRLVMCNRRYRDMNQGVADLLKPGLSWEILMRETARRGIYKDAIGREEEFVSDRLENGIQYIQDFELNQTDGTSYLVSVHPTNLGGFVVTRTDITDRKQAQSVEREGDMLVRHVLDSSPTAVMMARLDDGQIMYRSPAASELFGKAKSIRDFFQSADDRADYVTAILADGRVDDQHLTLINAQGEAFPALIYGRIAEYRGDDVVVTNVIDLTEQQKTEALINQVLEACQVPIQMTRAATGDVLFSTSETKALFGKVENSSGYYLSPDDRPALLRELREKGWYRNRRGQLVGAGGRVFWSSQSARLLEFNGEEVIVSNTRDLTDEIAMQEEIETQRNLLFQNEKMSALGELLAGVAHELNNPLSVVVGHALMMREEIHDPGLARRVEKIGNAAERCAKIVKTFLAMARQQPTKMERVDIGSVVATAVDVASFGYASEAIQIQQDLPLQLPDLMADPDQITQVLINLMINAEQAIAKSGIGDQIVVSARVLPNRASLELRVSDNGPGIPEKLRARVFEPFFTTKDVGDGTGIGLAFCHRIIHSHSGQIWLDPTTKQGACFCITLPLADAHSQSEADAFSPTPAVRALRALVVDDEPDVAELIAEILQRDGFDVEFASTAPEALTCMEKRTYNLILSDLNMPDIDGRGLYEIILRDHPSLADKIGFVTGDTMGATTQSFLREAKRPYVEKPVSPADLRKLVHTILATPELEA